MSQTTRTPAEVMRLYLEEVVARGNLALLDEIAAEDMVDHIAVAAGWGPGRQGLVKHASYFRSVMGDLQVDVERIVASADEVVGMWRARGTHQGNLFGLAATGRALDYHNASFFKVRNGQVIDYTGVWGGLDAVTQMGVPIRLPG